MMLMAAPQPGGELQLFPRRDGLLVEVSADQPLHPRVEVDGYVLRIELGCRISSPGLEPSIWVMDYRLKEDSTGLTVLMDTTVSSVDYALSADSTTMLAFLRAADPIEFPTLTWERPPPDTLAGTTEPPTYSDSLLLASFESGAHSPWLEEFDCIVLDPGHGGRDPGAVGPRGTYEKDRTLEIALLVRDLMSIRMPDVRVVMTREDDRYVSLWERTRIANREHADLFVSIHCNASTNRTAHGFETFFLSRARTDDARAVAALENGVIRYDEDDSVQPTDPLSFLLADIAQKLYLDQSSSLAATVQKSIELARPGASDRGVKQAGFYVLRGAFMPAILVEVAFISNHDEERMLQTLDFRYRLAEAIVSAVLEYSGSRV
jgi:N-acetylmuramoyl-L-alanine amidase